MDTNIADLEKIHKRMDFVNNLTINLVKNLKDTHF